MKFISVLSIAIYLSVNTPDTIFRVCSNIDTIYITSKDIVRVDSFGLFQLTYQLTKEMSSALHSANVDSCQLWFNLKNKNWILLQEYEKRAARIPEGYYVTTDFGNIVSEERTIHVGYNYPEKFKKRKNFRKR